MSWKLMPRTFILEPKTVKVAMLAEKGHDEDQYRERFHFDRGHFLGSWSSQSLLQPSFRECII
jgi:hypothetical protein